MLVHDLAYASFRKVGHPIGVVKRRDVPDVMSTLPTFWQRSVRNVRNSSRYLRRDTAVKKDATRGPGESTPVFEHLEEWTRGRIQEWMQELLVEEVTELLGRGRYDQRGIDAEGYRNGFGKPRQLTMRTGTISVRRPRVRGLEERFESRILPLFVKRTHQVRDLMPPPVTSIWRFAGCWGRRRRCQQAQ